MNSNKKRISSNSTFSVSRRIRSAHQIQSSTVAVCLAPAKPRFTTVLCCLVYLNYYSGEKTEKTDHIPMDTVDTSNTFINWLFYISRPSLFTILVFQSRLIFLDKKLPTYLSTCFWRG